MKTQILRLETHDDTASIRDKISWAKAGRILLAFPRRRSPRLSRLDLTLIQRAVTRTGAQLAFTTRDPDLIRMANLLDIPVFPSIQAAQRSPWLVVNRKRKVFRHPQAKITDISEIRQALSREPKAIPPKGLRVLIFTLGLASFAVLILLFIPGAVIDVSPTRESQTINLTVLPQVGIPGVLPGGQIPAAEVHTTVSGEMEAVATGQIEVPYTVSQVTLLVTNRTDEPVVIPAGTVFLTLDSRPQRFSSLSIVELAAGIGETAEIPAKAMLPGSQGNVAEGTIQAVESQLGLYISVINPSPAEAGTDRVGRAASETDYSQLYDSLITSLVETAVTNLEAQYGKELIVISESMKVDRVVEDRRFPAVNSPSDRVSLTLTADISGMAVSREDMIAAAAFSMDSGLASDKTVIPGSYVFKSLTSPVLLSDERIAWEVQATRQLVQGVKVNGLAMSIKGLEITEAQRIIQADLDLEEPPRISLFPSWLPRLPLVPFRIKVIGS